jgi:hypothetical protein
MVVMPQLQLMRVERMLKIDFLLNASFFSTIYGCLKQPYTISNDSLKSVLRLQASPLHMYVWLNDFHSINVTL